MKRNINILLVFIFCFAFLVGRSQCNTTKLPIVFVHGFLASGDTYTLQIQRFIEAGYCSERLFVFDWNSVGGNGKNTDSLLNNFVDTVLKKTNAAQIVLIGHSAGGGLGRGFVADSERAKKIAYYIHIGSRKWAKEFPWFSNNKCLNIYSREDKVMGTGANEVEGAINIDLLTKDHYEVATSIETFEAMYKFINNNAKPIIQRTKKKKPVYIGGKAVFLGDNEPVINATISIYQIDPSSAKRLEQNPDAVFEIASNGNWGPFIVSPKAYYEIELIPGSAKQQKISYFFEPFTITNKTLYLRGFPQGNMISMMLGNLPAKEDQSAIVIFSANKAMIGGRDSVTVNGTPVSSPKLTPAAKTIISSFIFDNGDGKTSGEPLKQFAAAPFIGGVDVSLPVNNKKGNVIFYNGRKLVLPATPSKERILLAVFN